MSISFLPSYRKQWPISQNPCRVRLLGGNREHPLGVAIGDVVTHAHLFNPNVPRRPPRNAGTARRSVSRPLGEEAHPSVRTGNVLCARTLIVLLVAATLGCWWVLEQPRGSTMELHPCFQAVMKMLNCWRSYHTMESYGAMSKKPTWLYSSHCASMWSKFVALLCFVGLKWIWYRPENVSCNIHILSNKTDLPEITQELICFDCH